MPHCPFLLHQLEIRLGQKFLILWLPLLLSIFPIGHKMAMAKSASSEHFSRSAHFHRIESTAGGTGHHSSAGGGIIISGGGTQRLNRCYSCMSPLYEQLFKESDLGSFFYEPRNFTAQCEEPMDPRGIGLVPCRGICLSLAQQFVIMGRKTGKRLWMRGCAHSLSRHGYQNRTIAFFAEFDLCREVHASDLFRLADHSSSAGASGEYFGGGNGGGGFMGGGGGHQSAGGPMDGQSILVCSCLGDRCNHQSSAAISAKYSRLFIIFLLIPLLRIAAPFLSLFSPIDSLHSF